MVKIHAVAPKNRHLQICGVPKWIYLFAFGVTLLPHEIFEQQFRAPWLLLWYASRSEGPISEGKDQLQTLVSKRLLLETTNVLLELSHTGTDIL